MPDTAVHVGDADHLVEASDGLGGDAPAAQTCDRGQPRVIPTGHLSALHEPNELSLAQHRVVDVETCELGLLGTWPLNPDGVERPVVDLPVYPELERAQRMSDVLDRVLEAVRVVVHRVDAPVVAVPVVMLVPDTEQQRIAHEHVRLRHVDPRAQHVLPVLELAGSHAAEQVETLVHGPVAVRAVPAGLGDRAAVFADLRFGETVDVGLAVPDELLAPLVHLLEVIRREVQPVLPVDAQPADVLCSSLVGFVSSNRRLKVPPYSWAMP